MDYEYYKREFWMRNRFRDVYMDFKETRKIPGLNYLNLVNIGNENPCTVNFFLYFLFTILTLSQFYKSYVNSFCITQNFKIRKIISTRYDLNQEIYTEKYSQLNPSLNLISQQYNYKSDDYNYLNKDINVDYPTKEELEKAKQYENKIPDYNISKGLHAGVIVDNPKYSSYDDDLPPAEFASVSGNAGLNDDQINANGEAPPGFGKPGFQFSVTPPVEKGYSKELEYYTPGKN